MDNFSENLDDQIKQERLKEEAAGTGRKARVARLALKRQTNKTGCPNGHAYNQENTLYNAIGRKMCLICLRDKRIYSDRPADRTNARKNQEIINLNNISETLQKPADIYIKKETPSYLEKEKNNEL